MSRLTIHHVFGVRFARRVGLVTRVIVFALCTLPLLILLWLFHRLLVREGEAPEVAEQEGRERPRWSLRLQRETSKPAS